MTFTNQQGFISLSRKFAGWEWYTDIQTKTLFLHLLLAANWENGSYQGVEIKRGQVLTSLRQLSDETGLSFSEVRTAKGKLKRTGYITQVAAQRKKGKGELITIEKYEYFVGSDSPPTQVAAQAATQEPHKSRTRAAQPYIDNKQEIIRNNNTPALKIVGQGDPLPHDWLIGKNLYEWHKTKDFTFEWMNDEASAFKRYYAEHPEKRWKDWDACFQQWCNRSWKRRQEMYG